MLLFPMKLPITTLLLCSFSLLTSSHPIPNATPRLQKRSPGFFHLEGFTKHLPSNPFSHPFFEHPFWQSAEKYIHQPLPSMILPNATVPVVFSPSLQILMEAEDFILPTPDEVAAATSEGLDFLFLLTHPYTSQGALIPHRGPSEVHLLPSDVELTLIDRQTILAGTLTVSEKSRFLATPHLSPLGAPQKAEPVLLYDITNLRQYAIETTTLDPDEAVLRQTSGNHDTYNPIVITTPDGTPIPVILGDNVRYDELPDDFLHNKDLNYLGTAALNEFIPPSTTDLESLKTGGFIATMAGLVGVIAGLDPGMGGKPASLDTLFGKRKRPVMRFVDTYGYDWGLGRFVSEAEQNAGGWFTMDTAVDFGAPVVPGVLGV
ncbi:hypothetical protein BJ508DRAFT_305631 [Ascobolus immersus RN42]|uniref:Uncharacterized protein n=1 Tax=Ascobolus immersus RN42 TaxID=1160509 RepID=A0A3N4I8T3_ASCIM|nr:hypothetical protein BJ508DRAFT_305631 [Ascobolus immersus RN42]